MANFIGLIYQIASVKRENKSPENLHMVPPNNFFIMDLIETFHISRKWAFFGLLSHALFPLPIHLLRENFDFECTNIIKHHFVLKSKKKKEFTVP